MALKNLALWADRPYRNDAIFDAASPLNRDNCLSAFGLLKDLLAKAGWDCHTHDVYKARGGRPDAVLFLDIPAAPVKELLGGWGGARSLAVLQECEVIKPRNWDKRLHAQFDALFTWSPALVDGRRYFMVNFANHFPEPLPQSDAPRDKFCLTVAAHKMRNHPLEIYSEREKTIRWFEENHPGDFDLYGVGWDRPAFKSPALTKIVNRLPLLPGLLAPRFPSYRGPLAQKRAVMEKYKFAVCYENARDIPGYITEKIFDCFFAGCIPVYLGAGDIAEHIPEKCFIDRRNFKTHEELYSYMKALPQAELAFMREAARNYLSSEAACQFSDNYFAATVAGVVSRA